MTEQSKKVLSFLQERRGHNLTAIDVAKELGMTKRMVDAIYSSTIVKNGLGERITMNGSVYLVLSPAGFLEKI